VRIVTRGHGPENAKLVGNEGGARQELGDRQAGNGRRDRSELTPDLGRGVRLGIPRRMLGRAPHKEQDNARPGPAEGRGARQRAGGRCTGPQQVGQAQPCPETAQPADPDDLTAVLAVTETNTGAEETEHRGLSASDPKNEKQVLNKRDCSDTAG
jgi:hypothetical protein